MATLVGKIGQKMIFNRSSSACDRSNTNGNFGTYKILELLFENNKNEKFYVISNNDLEEVNNKWENVFDYKDKSVDEIKHADKMLILAGLKEYENDNRFIDIINNLSAKFIILADDPRCLESMSDDDRMLRLPDRIVSQFKSNSYDFKGKKYKVDYVHLERAICYKEPEIISKEKKRKIIAIANTSGDKYNRLEILSNLIQDIDDIEVYGRANEYEKSLIKNHKGEIKYNDMQEILSSSVFSILLPIRKGWVTSKYVECLMNNVCPIFYCDYNTSLLESDDFCVVSDNVSLKNVLREDRKSFIQRKVNKWYNAMIRPYIDGKKLSEEVMSL